MKVAKFCLLLNLITCQSPSVKYLCASKASDYITGKANGNMKIVNYGGKLYREGNETDADCSYHEFLQILLSQVVLSCLCLLCPVLKIVGGLVIQNLQKTVILFCGTCFVSSLIFLYNENVLNQDIDEFDKMDARYRFFRFQNKNTILFYILKVVEFVALTCILYIVAGIRNNLLDGKLLFLLLVVSYLIRRHYLLYKASQNIAISLDDVKEYYHIETKRRFLNIDPKRIRNEIDKTDEWLDKSLDNRIHGLYKFKWVLLNAFILVCNYALYTCVNTSFLMHTGTLFPILTILIAIVLFLLSGHIIGMVFQIEDSAKRFDLRKQIDDLRSLCLEDPGKPNEAECPIYAEEPKEEV